MNSGFDERRRGVGWVKDHLRYAVTVAKIDEQPATVVAVAIDPPAQGGLGAGVGRAQFAAGMCA
jgi:hypothetical protein